MPLPQEALGLMALQEMMERRRREQLAAEMQQRKVQQIMDAQRAIEGVRAARGGVVALPQEGPVGELGRVGVLPQEAPRTVPVVNEYYGMPGRTPVVPDGGAELARLTGAIGTPSGQSASLREASGRIGELGRLAVPYTSPPAYEHLLRRGIPGMGAALRQWSLQNK